MRRSGAGWREKAWALSAFSPTPAFLQGVYPYLPRRGFTLLPLPSSRRLPYNVPMPPYRFCRSSTLPFKLHGLISAPDPPACRPGAPPGRGPLWTPPEQHARVRTGLPRSPLLRRPHPERWRTGGKKCAVGAQRENSRMGILQERERVREGARGCEGGGGDGKNGSGGGADGRRVGGAGEDIGNVDTVETSGDCRRKQRASLGGRREAAVVLNCL